MQPPPEFDPKFQTLKRVLLQIGEERSLEGVLQRIVRGAAADRLYAHRVCIWLLGDENLPSETTASSPCLLLAASAFKEGAGPDTEWTHADGDFAQVPLHEPLIGVAAREARLQVVATPAAWPEGQPDWARQEGVVSYGAAPLQFRGEVLGVLGFFGCILIEGSMLEEGLEWLRIFADRTATEVAYAHALDELEHLRENLEQDNEYLRQEVREALNPGGIVGQSAALKKCMGQIELVAPTDANVLILGESGTGKELVARAIHERSQRSDRPLIKVNCASVPRDLFESEFFGHVKGAYTGAHSDRKGRFQLADEGTLFLDEIGEIPRELQGKLLRVLQESTFERLGAEVTQKVDVRIIAATNRDLQEEVEARRFRQDLYYRLSVFPVELVPLRDRPEDIPLLCEHFLAGAARSLGTPKIRLKRRDIIRLQGYHWPGNVRELENVMWRAAITARSGQVRIDLPTDEAPRVSSRPALENLEDRELIPYPEWREREKINLRRALDQAGWKISGRGGAAELLQIKPTTLRSRIKAMGLQNPTGNSAAN